MANNRGHRGEFWLGFVLSGALVGIAAFLLFAVPRQGGPGPRPSGQADVTHAPEGGPTAQVPQAVGSVVYPPPNAVETTVAHATHSAIADLEAIARATAYVATTTAIAQQQLPLWTVDYGSWKYELRRFGGVTWVNIYYEYSSSVEKFQAYVQANKELSVQLASGVDSQEEVTVFFNAISPKEFNDWAAASQMQIKEVKLRILDANELSRGSNYNPEFTIYPRPGDSVPLNEAEVAKAVDEKAGHYPGVGLKGVYTAVVVVPRARLSNLAADPLPILVEVTPLVVRDALMADGVPGAKDMRINAPGLSYLNLDQLQPQE